MQQVFVLDNYFDTQQAAEQMVERPGHRVLCIFGLANNSKEDRGKHTVKGTRSNEGTEYERLDVEFQFLEVPHFHSNEAHGDGRQQEIHGRNQLGGECS